jgi:hypothetical protein
MLYCLVYVLFFIAENTRTNVPLLAPETLGAPSHHTYCLLLESLLHPPSRQLKPLHHHHLLLLLLLLLHPLVDLPSYPSQAPGV